ncbi:RING-H2 finger protein ATL60-like [Momordica charantia]|uniref:RING-type E3 ubiquitin transferase n=1 Tax=Momordica charantia TaxID=3673 RepID=A0A6J1CDV3_MOMCH|nr:RING-H2 finger protein ATL60-like [Momordica charantia]
MADPLLTLLFPMETLVPESPSPPIVHYTITLDLPTSILFSFTVILFFLFLFHVLNGFLQWFLDVRHGGAGDVELGEAGSSFFQAVAQNNAWVVGAVERAVERVVAKLEERRVRRPERLPPVVRFGSEKMRRRSENEECAICLEEFLAGEICQALPECNHFFHSDCIDVWFRKKFTCPVCRNCISA